jgi:SAM-dependent methyltransferase
MIGTNPMNDSESILETAEQNQSAEEFIASIAPMTATSGQINILRELGCITNRDSILEVWCGGGDLTAQLAEIGGRVVGSDYSLKLITAAKERFPRIEFAVSNADDLSFPDARFDVVVSNFTAHHYSSPEKNFSEARRVLKRGGRFLVTMPVQSRRVGFNIVLETAREFLELPEKIVKGGPLLDAESPDEIMNVMRIAGFQKCDGYERTNYTVLESIDTLLNYAWKKISLGDVPQERQERIRIKVFDRARAYRHSDGLYRFPDQVLAVRGDA